MTRRQGIAHTIRDGIVIINDAVMEEIARVASAAKHNARPNVVTERFLAGP